MEEIYCFAGNPLDRVSQRRRDAGWIASLLDDPETRLLPVHELKPLVRHASAVDLEEAEAGLNIVELVKQTTEAMALERFSYSGGRVERLEAVPTVLSTAENSVGQLNEQKG